MHGALALHRGTLFVGRWEKTAHVRAFDLDGAPLEAGFSFRDPELQRSVAAGLAVDDDRHLWVADTPAQRVRLFTLFGREIGGLGVGGEDLAPELIPDRAGEVRRPVDVAVEGDSDAVKIVVASGGERRHAVQVFGGSGRLVASLRPGGDPRGVFRGVAGVGLSGRTIAVAEGGAERIQVFRDGDYHFSFAPPDAATARRFEPTAVEPLADGRFLVAGRGAGSGLWLFGASGGLLLTLARGGEDEGEVLDPSDLAVEQRGSDRSSRVAVIDRDGERVQVFTLEGRCYGAFPGLPGAQGV
ncbi:MAG: hypothetical protein AAF682_28810 [Planctomycetota bacterium]